MDQGKGKERSVRRSGRGKREGGAAVGKGTGHVCKYGWKRKGGKNRQHQLICHTSFSLSLSPRHSTRSFGNIHGYSDNNRKPLLGWAFFFRYHSLFIWKICAVDMDGWMDG